MYNRAFKREYSYKVIVLFLLLLITSCEEILFEEDITEETITVLAPADNSVLNQSPSSFSWNSVQGVNQYEVQLVSPDFDNAGTLVLDTVVTQPVNSLVRFDSPSNLAPGSYQWRVTGYNNNYNTRATVSSFEIGSNVN